MREFCRRTGLDPGNASRLERGRIAPPADRAKLDEYAGYLELQEGSPEREEFIQLGQICARRIPDAVMDDEELVRNLPLLFRTCSGRKPTRGQLEKLVDMIRKA